MKRWGETRRQTRHEAERHEVRKGTRQGMGEAVGVYKTALTNNLCIGLPVVGVAGESIVAWAGGGTVLPVLSFPVYSSDPW